MIDQQAIEAAKAVDLADLVRSRGVELAGSRNEFKGLCPFHGEKTPSFTVNTAKGFYHCFGCGQHGDAIDFVQEHDGVTFHEAVYAIVSGPPRLGSARVKKPVARAQQVEDWLPITPVPEGAEQHAPCVFNRPSGDKFQRLEASRRWAYRDATGALIGYVCRFDLPDGGKDLVPQSWCVNTMTGETRWKWRSFAKPRPIYGLDKLARYPKANVIVVEGEKTSDAAQDLFIASGVSVEKLVVVSWPGGARGVKHVDWSSLEGRKVGLWPDADQKRNPEGHERARKLLPFLDQPGTLAMLDVFESIKLHCPAVKFFLPRAAGIPDGWDLADEVPADFDLLAHLKTHAMNAADVQERFSPTSSTSVGGNILPVWLVPPTDSADLRRASFAADVLAMFTENELQQFDPRGVILRPYRGLDGLRAALEEVERLLPGARLHVLIDPEQSGEAVPVAQAAGASIKVLQADASWIDDLWATVSALTGLQETALGDLAHADSGALERALELATSVGANDSPSGKPRAEEQTSDTRPTRYFAVLGFSADKYYIFHYKKQVVLERSRTDFASEVGLVELAPRQWWEINNFGGKRGGIDKVAAAQWIFSLAHDRGHFDPENRMRGRGAWNDKGRSVFHHGDHLTVDGAPMGLPSIESQFIYENKASIPAISRPATPMQGDELLTTARLMRWVNPASAMLLCGWVFLAPLSGALHWRPHIWITGESGSGKSHILRNFVGSLLGPMKLAFDGGDSSAAGIRQKLKRDALPVVLDETEAKDDRGRDRIRGILTMARGSSTDSDSVIAKGTVNGRALEFIVRSMFCLCSIGAIAQEQESDNSRFATLALRNRSDGSTDQWEQLKPALAEINRDEDLPARLLSRGILMLPTLHKCIEVFAAATAKRLGSERYGDQYGTLLAGCWCLTHDEVVADLEAERIVDSFRWDDYFVEQRHATPDASKCLDAILDSLIAEKGSTVSIRALVALAAGRRLDGYDIQASTARRLLQDRGLTITNDEKRGRLLGIIRGSKAVADMLRGTDFASDWQSQLPRVNGYIALKPTSYGSTGQNRGHGFPLSSIRLPDEPGRGGREPAF